MQQKIPEIAKAQFLQTECPFCGPTNSVKEFS